MKNANVLRLPVFAAGALAMAVLAGCVQQQAVPQTPAYRAGYADGCQSARYEVGQPTTFLQDRARMAEADYSLGWKQGHDVCYFDAVRDQQRRDRNQG